MNFSNQISRYMSLREPQRDSLAVLEDISAGTEYKSARIEAMAALATEKSRDVKPIEFETAFPSFCFALATGVGKTRLMGACIYYLWRQKGYRHFFILTPGMTIYDKLRAELHPSHPKYMFPGLSDFPQPEVYDGDSFVRFSPGQTVMHNPATIFVFNIGKIFKRTDVKFQFHDFKEVLGAAFSEMLRGMDDLVVLMDESHRYRGAASLKAINHLKPVLGLEFTATPLEQQKNVVYSFGLAQSLGRFVKTPVILTRTNLTTADAAEMERLKIEDGLTRHEFKMGRFLEYAAAHGLPRVKPFVLISTRDTEHAAQVRQLLESDSFREGRYKGRAIEIHSAQTGAESDENVRRLLAVEEPTSTVEIVIHVNMLKEGWDVKNLCTIIPLRPHESELLNLQTLGRGLRLPFGKLTGDEDLDSLEIVAHDKFQKIVDEAKNSPLFRFKKLDDSEWRRTKTVPVTHRFIQLEAVLDRLAKDKDPLFYDQLTDRERLNEVVRAMVEQEAAAVRTAPVAATAVPAVPGAAQPELFGIQPQVEVRPFDPVTREQEIRADLEAFTRAIIAVPDIETEAVSEQKLEPFAVTVNRGPFELVEQRVLTRELASGKEHVGEQLEVIAISNPRAFLAARLIDAVEEMDAANDKEMALQLVDAYLAAITKPADELPRVVHLYREAIVEDLRSQVEEHIRSQTRVDVRVRRGFIQFRPYAKTVLEKDGIVHFTTQVPKQDIRRYLFDGYAKTLYPQVPFDSTPEKDFSAVLERDTTVLKWIRPAEGNIPIRHRGGTYTPDFVVETVDEKFIIEVKAQTDLTPRISADVLEKARVAIRWCAAASTIPGSRPWQYKLISEDAVQPTLDLQFILGHAVRVPIE